MFGNLFEEDYSSVSNTQYGKGKKLKTKALEPPAPREFTKLSRIRNQRGTYYLNSLFQTLHFTPEFRGVVKSMYLTQIIPLQLQRLFAQLLLLDQEAASTTDLTDSFGWTSNEENFLDLTVAVKNISGLEDALWNMYVEEEVFDYDNLYHCGTCDRLVKAAKVGRVQIKTSIDCEPLLLNVLYLATSSEREECQQLVECPYIFPSNAKVGTVFTAFTVPVGIILINNAESKGYKVWTSIPKEDMSKTFREQGLKNGSLILIQNSNDQK